MEKRLGIWNSLPATLAAEALFFGVGVWVYTRSTRAETRAAKFGWWIFVAFLAVVFCANLWGPPPEEVEQIAFVTLALWVTPLWAWSFDHRRTVDAAVSRN